MATAAAAPGAVCANKTRAVANVALALAADTAERLGLAPQGTYQHFLCKLDNEVRDAVLHRRRCTVSWQTDTSTLRLLRQLSRLRHDEKITPEVVASVAIFVAVVPNGLVFERMGVVDLVAEALASEPNSAAAPGACFRDRFVAQFHVAAPGASTPFPPHLATGVRTLLRPMPGNSTIEKAAAFAQVLVDRSVEACDALESPEENVAGRIQTCLGLPLLRCVMFLRVISLCCEDAAVGRGVYNWSRFDCGQGATWSLSYVCGGQHRNQEATELSVCQMLEDAMTNGDDVGILESLESHGVMVRSRTNLEHLLCEARKALHPGTRVKGGPRTPNAEYCDLFSHAQQSFYATRAAALVGEVAVSAGSVCPTARGRSRLRGARLAPGSTGPEPEPGRARLAPGSTGPGELEPDCSVELGEIPGSQESSSTVSLGAERAPATSWPRMPRGAPKQAHQAHQQLYQAFTNTKQSRAWWSKRGAPQSQLATADATLQDILDQARTNVAQAFATHVHGVCDRVSAELQNVQELARAIGSAAGHAQAQVHGLAAQARADVASSLR